MRTLCLCKFINSWVKFPLVLPQEAFHFLKWLMFVSFSIKLCVCVCIHRCQAPSPKEFLPEVQEAEEQTDTAFQAQTPVEEFESSSPLQEEPEIECEPEVDIKPEAESTPGSKSPISEEQAESEEEPDVITQQPQSVSSSSVSDTPVNWCFSLLRCYDVGPLAKFSCIVS